jgi:hypothetical protein
MKEFVGMLRYLNRKESRRNRSLECKTGPALGYVIHLYRYLLRYHGNVLTYLRQVVMDNEFLMGYHRAQAGCGGIFIGFVILLVCCSQIAAPLRAQYTGHSTAQCAVNHTSHMLAKPCIFGVVSPYFMLRLRSSCCADSVHAGFVSNDFNGGKEANT